MSNLEIGQEIRQKLDFYLIAIALAVLGLSVQTANFGNYIGADCAELLAWLALLASALFGLARIDGTPKLYRAFHLVQKHDRASQVSTIGADDESTQAVEDMNAFVKTRRALHRVYYSLHQYALLLAFVLLLVARSYAPVIGITNRLSHGFNSAPDIGSSLGESVERQEAVRISPQEPADSIK